MPEKLPASERHNTMHPDDDNFLTRWSRRKQQVRKGEPLAEPLAAPHAPPPCAPACASAGAQQARSTGSDGGLLATPEAESGSRSASVPPHTVAQGAQAASELPAPPTLADVGALTRESDYSRFMASNVQPEVKNAALTKLFQDPHFNVMDGLDVYIDDYGKPDPLPESMLRKMFQAQAMGLFADEAPIQTTASEQAAIQASATEATPATEAAEDPAQAELTGSIEPSDLPALPLEAADPALEDLAVADAPTQSTTGPQATAPANPKTRPAPA